MRTLGVDLGERRVGLAISDEDGMIASPLRFEPVRSLNDTLNVIQAAVEELNAVRVVVGHPRNMNGRSGPKAREAESVVEALSAEGFAVILWDERLTTSEAERSLKEANLSRKARKQHVDAVAAQLILQSFLDSRARNNSI